MSSDETPYLTLVYLSTTASLSASVENSNMCTDVPAVRRSSGFPLARCVSVRGIAAQQHKLQVQNARALIAGNVQGACTLTKDCCDHTGLWSVERWEKL